MMSPFPGMDPYLEDKEHWPGFHHHLAEELMTVLNATLSSRYFAEVHVRTVLEEGGIAIGDIYPDTAVLEIAAQVQTRAGTLAIPAAPLQRTAVMPSQTKLRAVHVYVTETKKLVTSIEILSPVNKQGNGLEAYRQKRRRILLSDVHLIELDLLRGGQRPGWEVNNPPLVTEYVLLINRANTSDVRISEIWPVALNEPLPVLPVPLLAPDPDVPLVLGEVFNNIYQRAAYARRLTYTKAVPPPKLRPTMKGWLDAQPAMGS